MQRSQHEKYKNILIFVQINDPPTKNILKNTEKKGPIMIDSLKILL